MGVVLCVESIRIKGNKMYNLISNNQTFVEVVWYGTVGIVLVQDNLTFEMKSYIKDIHKVNGPSGHPPYTNVLKQTEKDVLDIMAYGTTFSKEASQTLFSWVVFDETQSFKIENPGFVL